MMASGGGGSAGASILGEERRFFEGAPPDGSCLEGATAAALQQHCRTGDRREDARSKA